MTDNKKSSRRRDDEDTELRAGVSVEAEREARSEAKETADEPAISQEEGEFANVPLQTTPDGTAPLVQIYTDLPDNGTVLDAPAAGNASPTVALVEGDATYGNHYNDEFNGQGGTFVIDGETGERKRAFIALRDDKGKVTGYTPAP